jgi:long-subunit fatty acid transport protein
MRRRALALALAWLGLTAGPHAPATAQVDPWAPEFAWTRDAGTSARALGLGGAYLAISEDAAALRYNPAGLARVQRVEISGSVTDRSRAIETEYRGRAVESRESVARLSALGLVYPFPSYRGSLVMGLGYASPWPLDLQYAREGPEPGLPREQICDQGSISEWSFGLAYDAGPTVSLGFRASLLHGGLFQEWYYAGAEYGTAETTDLSFSGYTGSVGAMVRVRDSARVGLVFDLPRLLKWDGIRDSSGTEYWVVDQLRMPFSVAAGAALPVKRLLLAADARFTDWTDIDYQGVLRYWDGARRRMAYRRTWELHAGAEYVLDAFSAAGLRLRAGWAWEPVPYGILLEDIRATGDPVYREARFRPDRSWFALGAGVLVGESLTVDAAFAVGRWKRMGENLSEEETERRLLISTAFRLE